MQISEQEKMDNIKKISKKVQKLVHTRWQKNELEDELSKICDRPITLFDVDESGLVCDYAFIAGIYEDLGYMDIYYLSVPYDEDGIFITEINVINE